jgi:hypothetical protein
MSDDDTHTRDAMVLLEQVVRVAALPAERQIESFPSFCVVADEIALDYDNCCGWALEGYKAPVLTDEQRSSLVALDERLNRMSGKHNAELWTDEALRCSPEWDEVRKDARRIMDSFGWSMEDQGQKSG